MTSATIKPTRGGRHEERHGYGLVLFASTMLLIVGCFNPIYGIAAVANAHVFVAGAHYVLGDLRFWGWATLIIGGLQLLAAAGGAGGQPAGPLVRRGRAQAQRHRHDVIHPRLPVPGAGDPRRGRQTASPRSAPWCPVPAIPSHCQHVRLPSVRFCQRS